MKELGYTQIKFKKNDGEWHRFMCTKLSYSEPYEIEHISFTYEEFINEDFEFKRKFHKTKDSLFPWGKKCLYWNDLLMDESEWIYPGDTISFEFTWTPEIDMSFYNLMKNMSAEDFIDYCKSKGISISLNI